MKRRSFLTHSAASLLPLPDEPGGNAAPPARGYEFANTELPRFGRTVTSGLEMYTGPWDFERAAHLLRRTTFGARKSDIDAALALSMSEAVNRLLASEPLPSPPLARANEYYKHPTTGAETFGANAGETWTTRGYDGGVFEGIRIQSLQAWWLGLMVQQSFSIRETMTLFWHNHFVSEWPDVGDARMMFRQNDLLRRNMLGNVKDLAREITLDPAMLRYLNGNTNTRASANENYARELQELFTIGKGPTIAPGNYTNYTEDDVKAAARVLTGWKDVREPLGISFNAAQHDTTDKAFSSAYGNTVVKGTATGETGARAELDALLDMIFAQDETARAIVRKLYRYFVYYVIDAATEQNVIAPLAGMLRSGGYAITPVLGTLLKSAHFFDAWNAGCVIRHPVDHAVGTIRQFAVALPDPVTQLYQLYGAWLYAVNLSATGQMTLLAPPNVAGWPVYWQEPMFYEIWITSDTLPKRNQFTDLMAGSGVTVRDAQSKNPFIIQIDPFVFLTYISDPADPYKLIDEAARYLLPIALTQAQKDTAGTALMNTPNYYEWTSTVWNPYVADPTNATKKNLVATRLRGMLKHMMNLAEYQLS